MINSDIVIDLTRGYTHLFNSEQGQHIIMAYGRDKAAKLIKITRKGEVETTKTLSKIEIKKALNQSIEGTFNTLDTLMQCET